MNTMKTACRRRWTIAAAAVLAVPAVGRANTVYTFTGAAGSNWDSSGTLPNNGGLIYSWNVGSGSNLGYPNAATSDAVIPAGFGVNLDILATVGNFNLGSGSSLTILGNDGLTVAGPTMVDNGTVTVNTQSNATSTLNFSSSTVLSGTGNINLLQNGDRALLLTAAGATLTQNAGHTIHGFGDIEATLVNKGTVNADYGGPQYLFVRASTVTNQNLITATSGALQFDTGTTVNNAGGTISNNGGTVVFSNTAVTGGTLTSTAGSTALQLFDAETLNAVTVSAGTGLVVEANATTTVGGGTLVDNGTITVNPQTNGTSALNFSTNTTLSGTGNIDLLQTGSRALLLTAAGATLTQSSGHLIHGYGDATVRLVNQGTVNADYGGPQFLLFHTSTITNTGLLTATAGALQIDTNSVVNNSGGTISNNGGRVLLSNSTITGGTLTSTNGSSAIESYDATALNAVTLSAGTGLVVEPNATTTVGGGTLVDNGTITVNPQTNGTSALNFSTNTTLSGTGNIDLLQNGNRALLLTAAGATLNQSSGHLIHGYGDATVRLVNQGTVNADYGGPQYLAFHSSTITNTGLLTATAGALQFDTNSVVNNSGGTISVNGGYVVFSNTTVTGGTLTTTNGSTAIQALDGTALNAVTLSAGTGLVVEPNATTTVGGGTLVDNGTITVNPQTNGTSALNFSTNTTLSGTGNIDLLQNGNRALLLTAAGATLTQSAGHLIHGYGDATVRLVNQGTVNADYNGQVLAFHAGAVTNTALLTATVGGLLQFDTNSTVNNSGGTISNNGGRVLFSNSAVNGGTLTSTNGSSAIEAYDGTGLSNLTLSTGSGLVVEPNSTVTVPGGSTVTNNGTITVNLNTGATSTLTFSGAGGTLAGTGTVELFDNGDRAFLTTTGAAGVITQAATHTIAGFGDVDAALVNNGTVNANYGGQGILLQASPANASTGVTNNNLIEATGTGFVNVNGITIAQSAAGKVLAADGSQVNVNGGNVSNGTVQSTGSGIVNVNTGTFNIVTVATGSNVLVTPGNTLTIVGTLADNGTITVNQNTGATSVLLFSGNVALTGTGLVHLFDGGDRAFVAGTAGAVVAQDAQHTIDGFGDVTVPLVNNGTVNADFGGQSINFQSPNPLPAGYSPTAVVNGSLIEATGTGNLNFNGVPVTQTGNGRIFAGLASTVNVNGGSSVNGGLLAAAVATVNTSGGQFYVNGGVTVTNVSTGAGTPVLINPGATLTVAAGSLTDNGTITVNQNTGATSTIAFAGTAVLNGSGTVYLFDNGSRALLTTAAGATVTQAAAHTIAGFGDVDAALVNNGTVNANYGGQAINLNTSLNASTGVTNNALIEATGTNGASINVNGITLTQSAAGLLTATAGSNINLNGATITGGTLASAGSVAGSTIYVNATSTLGGGITVAAGSFTLVQPNVTLNVTGPAAITDNGTTQVNTNSGGTSVYNVASSVTVNGTGDIDLLDNGSRALITAAAGATLTQGVSHTINGFGDVNAPLVNNGTVRADYNGQSINLNAAVTNNGLFYATAGGQLYVPAGVLSNLSATTLTGGTYQSDAGGFLNLPNAFVANAATVILGGGYNFPAVAPLQTNTGTFTLQANAAFTTAGNLATSGTLNVGGPAGAATTVVSSLAVNGTLTQTAGKTEVDGTLAVAGQTAVTGGTFTFGANTTASGVLTRTLPNGLTLGGTGVVALATAANRSSRTLLVLPSLTFGGTAARPTGELDVGQNDAVISNLSSASAFLAAASGYAAGVFNGSGITSSAAAADARRLTAVGVVLNNDGSGTRLYGTGTTAGLFDGYSPAATDVLAKYTYFGDANLDGRVNGQDYARVDAGFLGKGALTGWYNGDFNYDGKVDGSDYTLIDNAFNLQTAVLINTVTLSATPAIEAAATDEIAAVGTAAVPEPATVGLLAVAAGLALGRRRRVA